MTTLPEPLAIELRYRHDTQAPLQRRLETLAAFDPSLGFDGVLRASDSDGVQVEAWSSGLAAQLWSRIRRGESLKWILCRGSLEVLTVRCLGSGVFYSLLLERADAATPLLPTLLDALSPTGLPAMAMEMLRSSPECFINQGLARLSHVPARLYLDGQCVAQVGRLAALLEQLGDCAAAGPSGGLLIDVGDPYCLVADDPVRARVAAVLGLSPESPRVFVPLRETAPAATAAAEPSPRAPGAGVPPSGAAFRFVRGVYLDSASMGEPLILNDTLESVLALDGHLSKCEMATLSADERSLHAAGVGTYLARVQDRLLGGVAPPSSLRSPQQAADARVREGTSLTAWVETLETVVRPLCRRGNQALWSLRVLLQGLAMADLVRLQRFAREVHPALDAVDGLLDEENGQLMGYELVPRGYGARLDMTRDPVGRVTVTASTTCARGCAQSIVMERWQLATRLLGASFGVVFRPGDPAHRGYVEVGLDAGVPEWLIWSEAAQSLVGGRARVVDAAVSAWEVDGSLIIEPKPDIARILRLDPTWPHMPLLTGADRTNEWV